MESLNKEFLAKEDLGLGIYKGLVRHQTQQFLRIRNKEIDSSYPEKKELFLDEWNIYDSGNILEITHNYDSWQKMRKENPLVLLMKVINAISSFTNYLYIRGWKKIEIMGGTRLPQFVFWIEAQRCNLGVTGYELPDDERYWYNDIIKKEVETKKLPFKKTIDVTKEPWCATNPDDDFSIYNEPFFLMDCRRKILESGSNCLRLVNAEAIFSEQPPLFIRKVATGWMIDDYGDALEIRDPYVPDNVSSRPSIIDKIKTMMETVKLIVGKGWLGVEIISGPRILQFFLWVECSRYGIKINGYNPTETAIKMCDEIYGYAKSNNIPWGKRIVKEQKKDAESWVSVAGATGS